MASRIESVVFDMGGVLMTFDGLRFSRMFTESEEDARLLNQALFATTEWSLRDAGAIDDDTMAWAAMQRLPERLHDAVRRTMAGWTAYSEPVQGMSEVALELKQGGAKLYVLSNAGMNIMDQLGRSPAAPALDGVVFSAQERLMKPDVRIYRLLCERYSLVPETCLFVDDNALNVAAAQRAGMAAYRFDGNVAAFRNVLAGLGLKLG